MTSSLHYLQEMGIKTFLLNNKEALRYLHQKGHKNAFVSAFMASLANFLGPQNQYITEDHKRMQQ